MSYRIFYSWQSDSSDKANRYFIRDALQSALKNVEKEYEFEERLTLDHDTKNIPGTPPIFQTILSKIDQCSIFIADITFIAKTSENKFVPNPNVLIELGYAMKAVNTERYILVMNESFGKADGNLPFNLSHLRWPIRYCLDPESEKNCYKEVKEKLVSDLSYAIKVMIESGVLEETSLIPVTSLIDKELFLQFLQDFPSNHRSIYFLNVHDIGNSFLSEELDHIDHFLHSWNDAEHEFLDEELEQKRKALYDALKIFLDELCANVRPVIDHPEKLSIGIEDIETRPYMFELQKHLNNLATKAYKCHQDLVRAGRQILGSPPP